MYFDRNISKNKYGKKSEGSYLSCVTNCIFSSCRRYFKVKFNFSEKVKFLWPSQKSRTLNYTNKNKRNKRTFVFSRDTRSFSIFVEFWKHDMCSRYFDIMSSKTFWCSSRAARSSLFSCWSWRIWRFSCWIPKIGKKIGKWKKFLNNRNSTVVIR